MISVCMATYNGQKYIKEQIDSILCQLSGEDELVVSDDHSTDDTVAIVQSYADKRIKCYLNEGMKGVAHNFENALRYASGDVIFFADQDDVWLPGKVERMTRFLREGNYDVVTCNCSLVDANLNIIKEKHYDEHWPIHRSVPGNLVQNVWLGCCMAFTREVRDACLPFPPRVVAHDLWVALFAQLHFRCGYMRDDVLQLYRRHGNTVSFTGGKSTNSLSFRLSYRTYLAWHLLTRSLKRTFCKHA
ncbi:MAG: glycosyltransferase family 2 protein [Paraprevotella sp.]|nr:glycosyltransferase family 2 protein [Paraprevotella sp.]